MRGMRQSHPAPGLTRGLAAATKGPGSGPGRGLCLAGVALCLAGSATAQVRWFSPSDFDMTCRIDQVCAVGGACEKIADSFTIRHAPNEAPTFFEFPGQITMTGALAVMEGVGGHTLIASASMDGKTVYRLVAYTNARVTIMLSHDDTPLNDRVYYGRCDDALSGTPRKRTG